MSQEDASLYPMIAVESAPVAITATGVSFLRAEVIGVEAGPSSGGLEAACDEETTQSYVTIATIRPKRKGKRRKLIDEVSHTTSAATGVDTISTIAVANGSEEVAQLFDEVLIATPPTPFTYKRSISTFKWYKFSRPVVGYLNRPKSDSNGLCNPSIIL